MVTARKKSRPAIIAKYIILVVSRAGLGLNSLVIILLIYLRSVESINVTKVISNLRTGKY